MPCRKDFMTDTAPPTRVHGRFITTVVVSAAVIVAIVATGLILRNWAGATTADLDILYGLATVRTPFLIGIALTINWLFGPAMAVALTAAIAAVMLAISRRLRTTTLFVALVALPWLGSEIVKQIVRRPRPDMSMLKHPLITEPTSFSFPSGHTTFVTVLMLALLITVVSKRWRPLYLTIGIIAVVLTAMSRMYLGAHYLTDVTAAVIYSIAAVLLVSALAGRWLPRQAVALEEPVAEVGPGAVAVSGPRAEAVAESDAGAEPVPGEESPSLPPEGRAGPE